MRALASWPWWLLASPGRFRAQRRRPPDPARGLRHQRRSFGLARSRCARCATALIAATKTGDIEACAPSWTARARAPRVSFGDPEDPIAYLKTESADGEGLRDAGDPGQCAGRALWHYRRQQRRADLCLAISGRHERHHRADPGPEGRRLSHPVARPVRGPWWNWRAGYIGACSSAPTENGRPSSPATDQARPAALRGTASAGRSKASPVRPATSPSCRAGWCPPASR